MERKVYTLKLDASYRPIEIIEGLKGFSMVYTGRAQVVENHTHQLSALFYYPSVIVLKKYIRKKPVYLSPTRANIYWRDEHKCQYCAQTFEYNDLTLDHVIPKSRGGQKTWNNIVTCCKGCNQKKGPKTPSEASMTLLRKPDVPKFNVLRSQHGIKIPETWKNYL